MNHVTQHLGLALSLGLPLGLLAALLWRKASRTPLARRWANVDTRDPHYPPSAEVAAERGMPDPDAVAAYEEPGPIPPSRVSVAMPPVKPPRVVLRSLPLSTARRFRELETEAESNAAAASNDILAAGYRARADAFREAAAIAEESL